jgi:hypothetical protein
MSRVEMWPWTIAAEFFGTFLRIETSSSNASSERLDSALGEQSQVSWDAVHDGVIAI